MPRSRVRFPPPAPVLTFTRCHRLAAAALLAVAGLVFGASSAGSVVRGASLRDEVEADVRIPLRVAIAISVSSLNFNVADAAGYPPPAFPWFWGPPRTASGLFSLSLFSNSPNGFQLTVVPSGTPPPGLPFTDWFIALGSSENAPAPARPSGALAGPEWKALGTGVQLLNVSGRTTGWDVYNADLVLRFTGDEEPATSTVTLTYTISAS